MMGRARLWAVAVGVSAAVAVTAGGTAAMGAGGKGDKHDDKKTVRTTLTGYEEDPPVSTTGSGRFRAHIDEKNKKITYRLSYEDLEGGNVTQAHIHFGGRAQTGGIIVWLCGDKGVMGRPAGTQECPDSPATITGTIKPKNVVGPVEQGIEPGEFDELVDAIRAGVTYVNVHTAEFPTGEIRGQLSRH